MSDEAARKMRFLYALRSRAVTDAAVLGAMERIDRGPFVKGRFARRAYADMPPPLACRRALTHA